MNWNGIFYLGFKILRLKIPGTIMNLTEESSTQVLLKDKKAVSGFSQTKHYIWLLKMFVGVLTTCHTQYT